MISMKIKLRKQRNEKPIIVQYDIENIEGLGSLSKFNLFVCLSVSHSFASNNSFWSAIMLCR